jgi:hypothetical protein
LTRVVRIAVSKCRNRADLGGGNRRSLGILEPAMSETETTAPFACPRCGTVVTERFYGPCTPCRAWLVQAYEAEATAGEVEAVRFEPAMHVVPNHVATKD